MTAAKLSYRVLRDGPVAGRPRKAGDIVELTEAEAKYEAVTADIPPRQEAVGSLDDPLVRPGRRTRK